MDGTSDSDKLSSYEDGGKSSSSSCLNFKETELRLGLPGSESPERKSAASVSLFGKDLQNKHSAAVGIPLKNLVAGAKRGFSDAIDASTGKWGLSVSDGSDVELGKGAAFSSPRGGNVVKPLVALEAKTTTQKANNSTAAIALNIREGGMVPQSAKPVQEKVAGAGEHGTAPPAANRAQVVGWPPIRSFRKN